MGTPGFAEAGLKDIDRYTYWIMPIYPVAQAIWYRLFSFSLASMRALSIFCGLLGFTWIGGLAARFPPPDRGHLRRVAVHGHWREKNLRLAILLSQTLVAASGLTHPNGGMLSFLGGLWRVLYFDRRRIRPAHVAIAAIPYAAGALGWGAYIAQDPGAFVSEYGYQIATRSQIPTGALDGSAG